MYLEDAYPPHDLQSCSHVQFRTTSSMKWFEMGRWNEWCDFDVALWDFISLSASFKACKSFFKAGPTCSCFISNSRLCIFLKETRGSLKKGGISDMPRKDLLFKLLEGS